MGPPAPPRRAILGAALLGLGLAGCDEMRRPPGRSGLPPEINPGGPDPTRAAIAEIADSFGSRGQRLDGRPEFAARAIAQLEYVVDQIGREPRYAAISGSVRVILRLAREEVRQALGTRPEAQPGAVVEALSQVIRQLRLRDRAAAATALSAAIFNPGTMATLLRLGRLGPLPVAEQATAQLVAEVARLDAQGAWSGAVDRPETGVGTALSPGLGRGF